MTDTTDKQSKRPLGLAPGRLELKRTVETSQVRQSFSHGRTKTVTVEVKRKRSIAPGEAIPAKEPPRAVEPPAPPVEEPARHLTQAERNARVRALKGARDADEDTRRRLESDEARRRDDEARLRAADEERRRHEEERRRLAEVERRNAEEEAKRRSEDEAARRATQSPALKAELAPPEETDDSEEGRRRRAEARRVRPTPRVEPRRAGKLTIAQALDEDSMERMRSLASVRRARERERLRLLQAGEQAKIVREVVVPETITVQELANRMAERSSDVIKTLMKNGIMATINQTLDADTAELIVAEFGHKLRRVAESDVEIGLEGAADDPQALLPRAPVVTIMGHVDHGKTSLLDALRQSDVAAREAGGITQHIGAYEVALSDGRAITFIDTPGHEAFTTMRARGAAVTDIVVLVVAADDGVQPQTVEAIAHARAAKVPIIVAINKIDLPAADPNRVKTELLSHEIVTESMGGDTLAVEVSATRKTGLDRLTEAILLQAEVLELRANPDRPGQGAVIEAKLERGRGPVATVLVQRGTLKVGDILIAGAEWGRVRALVDSRGETVLSAGPSVPVEVLGLNNAPEAGDRFDVVESESRARDIAAFRERQRRGKALSRAPRSSLEEMFGQIAAGAVQELPIVIKGDVQGSIEAIGGALQKLSTDEVKVRVLHTSVGAITESDVALAASTGGVILGFNVRANPQAREVAKRDGVDIRYYSIIYELVDDVRKAMSGLLAPDEQENILGHAEVREVFTISKVGKVAGCMVTDGQMRRNAKARLLRDNVVVHTGAIDSLRRFKDEVRDVQQGYECGMTLANFGDVQKGDVIEAFEVERIVRSL